MCTRHTGTHGLDICSLLMLSAGAGHDAGLLLKGPLCRLACCVLRAGSPGGRVANRALHAAPIRICTCRTSVASADRCTAGCGHVRVANCTFHTPLRRDSPFLHTQTWVSANSYAAQGLSRSTGRRCWWRWWHPRSWLILPHGWPGTPGRRSVARHYLACDHIPMRERNSGTPLMPTFARKSAPAPGPFFSLSSPPAVVTYISV